MDQDEGRIEHLYTESNPNAPVLVRLDGRVVGEIRPVEGGWQYVPKGAKEGGEIFVTLGGCQRSLR